MSRRCRICVVGSVNMDLTIRAARLPRPGETLAGRDFQIGPGGKGANQAVMAARLGAHVAMVAKVGTDAFGQRALANLQAEGIDTSHVLINAACPTGLAAILVDDAGQNSILVVPGANEHLRPEEVSLAAEVIRHADIVLCQLEIPLAATLTALRFAKSAGVRTLFNPAPAQALPEEVLRLTQIAVLNETELEFLTGATISSPQDAIAAGRSLLERGPESVVVTLGAAGAVFLHGATAVQEPAPAVKAVDTSGAGDAFIGALAVALARGVELHEGVRRANQVAALTVTRLGTQASFPSSEQLQI